MKHYRYCPKCKAALTSIKEEDYHRLVCKRCGWVYYWNPLPSVAVFVRNHNDEILLIRRGVEPGKGKWALPSGFMEQKELPEETALRELKEETGIKGRIKRLVGVYTEPTRLYGDVLIVGYEVHATSGKLRAGSDTTAAKFFPARRIPRIPFAGHRDLIRDSLTAAPIHNPLIAVLKSKIEETIVTDRMLHYEGSMGIDAKIMKAANILPGEIVHVLNYDSGERLEVCIIEEKSGSGKIILYGPASLKGKIGHKLCVLAYSHVNMATASNMRPRIVILDRKNHIKRVIKAKP